MTTTTDDLEGLLAAAAGVAASNGMAIDAFMQAAWQAYVAKHPHLIEHVQNAALLGQLEVLRMQGRLPMA